MEASSTAQATAGNESQSTETFGNVAEMVEYQEWKREREERAEAALYKEWSDHHKKSSNVIIESKLTALTTMVEVLGEKLESISARLPLDSPLSQQEQLLESTNKAVELATSRLSDLSLEITQVTNDLALKRLELHLQTTATPATPAPASNARVFQPVTRTLFGTEASHRPLVDFADDGKPTIYQNISTLPERANLSIEEIRLQQWKPSESTPPVFPLFAPVFTPNEKSAKSPSPPTRTPARFGSPSFAISPLSCPPTYTNTFNADSSLSFQPTAEPTAEPESVKEEIKPKKVVIQSTKDETPTEKISTWIKDVPAAVKVLRPRSMGGRSASVSSQDTSPLISIPSLPSPPRRPRLRTKTSSSSTMSPIKEAPLGLVSDEEVDSASLESLETIESEGKVGERMRSPEI